MEESERFWKNLNIRNDLGNSLARISCHTSYLAHPEWAFQTVIYIVGIADSRR